MDPRWNWSAVDITDRPNGVAWVDRVRAAPSVGRGLAWGVPEDEIDPWSESRKARYRRTGATIAANDPIPTEGE